MKKDWADKLGDDMGGCVLLLFFLIIVVLIVIAVEEYLKYLFS